MSGQGKTWLACEALCQRFGLLLVTRQRGVMTLNPSSADVPTAIGEMVDLVKAGIIDPAKVTRSALLNTASIASLFLTTEAVVADKPEKAGAPMPGGDGGMGGMDF